MVTAVWTTTDGAVYVTEAWPEEFVGPLEELRLPEVVDQVMVLFGRVEPPEVRVAVTVVAPAEFKVKLLGEIDRAVAAGPAEGILPKTVRLSK
jgi:hypothetical protein